MTKEDYMKLSKERLAELLAGRDSQLVTPTIVESPRLSCFEGGPCTNPFHDCINCPRQTTGGSWTTTSTTDNRDYAEKIVLQVDPNTDLPMFRRMTQQHFCGDDLQEAYDTGAQMASNDIICRAIAWLQKNASRYVDNAGICIGSMSDDFKKAMEEL